jgi:hypothetical protein
MHKITVNVLLESKYFSDAVLYSYFNMGRHYICQDFTPRFRLSWAFHFLWWSSKKIFVQCTNAPDFNNNQSGFSLLDYLTSKYFNFAVTWWGWLFQSLALRTKFDMYVFISYDNGGIRFQIFDFLLLIFKNICIKLN